VLHTDHWVEINRISHGNAVRRISEALFDQFFPDVPSLPSTAFRLDKALLAELTPWERRLVQEVMDDYPALTLAKTIAMPESSRDVTERAAPTFSGSW
jgi:hypothetical protein